MLLTVAPPVCMAKYSTTKTVWARHHLPLTENSCSTYVSFEKLKIDENDLQKSVLRNFFSSKFEIDFPKFCFVVVYYLFILFIKTCIIANLSCKLCVYRTKICLLFDGEGVLLVVGVVGKWVGAQNQNTRYISAKKDHRPDQ